MTTPTTTPAGTVRWTTVPSPLGELFLARDEVGITMLHLPGGKQAGSAAQPGWVRDDAAFDDARVQLAEYFAGTRREFDLPLHPTGTAFQQRAWDALRSIPFGETASYAKQAAQLGSPTAFRAVGAANGRNPIAIVVPCHRVVGTNGSLTGYAGGVEAKQWLLQHEAAHAGLFA